MLLNLVCSKPVLRKSNSSTIFCLPGMGGEDAFLHCEFIFNKYDIGFIYVSVVDNIQECTTKSEMIFSDLEKKLLIDVILYADNKRDDDDCKINS